MSLRTSALLAWGVSAMILPARAAGKEAPATALVELKEGLVAPFDPANCHLSLVLAGALKDVHGDPTDLSVSARRAGGEWTAAQATSELWPGRRFGADLGGLSLTGRRLKGRIKLTVRPRRGKAVDLVYAIDAEVLGAAGLPKLPKGPAAAARARGAARVALGTYQGEQDAAGAKGAVAGHLARARRAGFFDRGRYDGGLVLDLDMGTRRVNWNHHRSAQYEFPEPRDLSAFTALRVAVRTDRPRDDASVTVWLAEEDGSWYHVKDAVPLVDKRNEAVLRLSDFALAEWVAPAGFHLDEDYVLDRKRIQAVAVGVINPLGVGVVSFTVTAIELLQDDLPAPPTVKLAVTGKTLSVNGHNVVPAAVFGGFARDMPQEYRPGCQRGLYPSTRPRIPRQTFVQFTSSQAVPDWPKVADKLRGKGPERPALYKHLMAQADDPEVLARFERVRPPKPGDKRAQLLPGEHEAIVEKDVFDRVQKLLAANKTYTHRHQVKRFVLLRRMIRCGHCGGRVMPNWTTRHGREYRYYACTTKVTTGYKRCPLPCLPAGEIETVVVDQLRALLRHPDVIAMTYREIATSGEAGVDPATLARLGELRERHDQTQKSIRAVLNSGDGDEGFMADELKRLSGELKSLAKSIRDMEGQATQGQSIELDRVGEALRAIDPVWDVLFPEEQRRIAQLLVEEIIVSTSGIDIRFRTNGIEQIVGELQPIEERHA